MISKRISNSIKARQSIYPNKFNGKLIDEKLVLELIDNANFAPSHKMTQPWFFKIFSENSKIRLLKEIFKINKISEIKKNKLRENFKKSSHIICICMKKNSHLLPEWEEIAATAMAVQNIWISCVGSKIGGYWSTPKFIENLNTFLLLNIDERCLGLFYLGSLDFKNEKNFISKKLHKKVEWFR